MRASILICFLASLAVLLCGCEGEVQTPQIVTKEVTRLVPKTQIETVEVTRQVLQTQVVLAEVTRVVQETVVVIATPQPQLAAVVSSSSLLNLPRAHHTATRLANGKILLVGGSQAPEEYLAEVELVDPGAGTAIPAAPMHTPRGGHTATLLADGRVLVVGGYNASKKWLEDAEIYDPAQNQWTVIPPNTAHGSVHSATLLQNGWVLVVGGCIGSGVCTARVEIFDPQSDRWFVAAPLPGDRGYHTAQLMQDGRVLVAGGWSAAGVPAGGDALVYEPQSNSWSVTGPMIVAPRGQAQSTRLPDGRILVVGGVKWPGRMVLRAGPSAETYDPASNTWTAAASLARARFEFVLASLADGRVLAVGGVRDWDNDWTDDSFVGEIELYDPKTDHWATVGELPQASAYMASVLLGDARLWVSGGLAGQARELYWPDSWMIDLIFN